MATTHHLKPKTVAGYESLLRAHLEPRFGRTSLVKIEPLDVREWVSDLVAAGLSPSRARQAYQLLSMIMKAAVESRVIARTPCVGVKLKRAPAREMLFLGAGEVDRLAAAAGSYSLLVYVLAYGGVRWGEACALRRKRYDQIRGRLEVAESLAEVNGVVHWGETKTYARRSVVLPRFVRALLDTHLSTLAADPDALLFTAPEGGPLRNSNFRRKVWFPALERAMLPRALRIHDLRHTCASLLIAENANPKAIQAHLRPLEHRRHLRPLRPPLPERHGPVSRCPGRPLARGARP